MIFEYDELRECVEEDFDRFYQMGFNEKQIYPAVLNEYENGKDFDQVENICIHIFLALNYARKEYNYDEIVDKLVGLVDDMGTIHRIRGGKMYNLKQDEFDKLLRQHQIYVKSLGKAGMKIKINNYNIRKVKIENTSLTDSFITGSIFYDDQFENVEIFDANLCGCEFKNVVFQNTNFVKTDLSYCIFQNCKFMNTKFKRCETYETTVEYSQFMSCDIYDSFSYSALKNITFCDMALKQMGFYEVIIDNIKLINIEDFDVNETVKSLNIGDFENKKIIRGEDAIEYFQKIVVSV